MKPADTGKPTKQGSARTVVPEANPLPVPPTSVAALSDSAQWLRTILRTAMDGFCQLDMHGRVMAVNDAYCRMTGYSEQELLALGIADLDVAETPDEVAAHIAHIKAAGTIRFETRHRRKDGTVFDVEVSAQYNHDEGGRIVSFLRDITDQKHAEHDLKSSEQRFRHIFRHAPLTIWEEDFSAVKKEFDRLRVSGVTDFRGYFTQHPDEIRRCASLVVITDVNEESLRFFVVKDKAELHANLASYFLDESWSVFTEELIALAEGNTRFEAELPIVDIRRQPRTLTLKLMVCPGSEDTLARVLVTFADLDERRRAESAISSMHEEMISTLENIEDGFFAFNDNMVVTYYNRAAELLLRRSRHNVLGRPLFDAFPEARGSVFEENYTRVLNERVPMMFETYFDRPPLANWYAVNVYPRPVGAAVFFQVVTERKRLEEQLLLFQQRMGLYFEQTPLAVIEFDATFTVREWNPAAERIFGYTRKEAIGRHYTFLVPVKARPVVDPVAKTLIQNQGGNKLTNENLTKGGAIIVCEWFNTTLVGPTGDVMGIVSLGHDITEHTKAEAAIVSQLDELRRWQSVMVDRESRVLDLKHEVNELLAKAGQPPKYPSAEEPPR